MRGNILFIPTAASDNAINASCLIILWVWNEGLEVPLNTLFQSIFDVVMSAVLVVNSPGYIIGLPSAVILTRFGSSFCSL